MPEDFLFVKGPDVGRKRNKRMSDPVDIRSSEMHGDVLFIKGVDVCTKNSVRDL